MAHTTLEEMIEAARTLPPEDRNRLREWLEAQEAQVADDQQRSETPLTDQERSQNARQWLDVNRAQYLGQWVALDGDRLIGHGTDGRQVMAQVKAAGIRQPFVEWVRDDHDAFCGGWLP